MSTTTIKPIKPVPTPEPKEPWSFRYVKDKLIDFALGVGILACLVLLYMTTGPVILHVACGLGFAAVAAYTLVKGQLAASSTERLAWYFCTGATAFLFLYWSFNYVFRPPKNQNTQGCGGVQFIHHEEL